MRLDSNAEWLEADGLGGFASGTAGLLRTRRYHALLLAAAAPPADRYVLVNGVEASVTTPAGVFPISAQAYASGAVDPVIHPDGRRFIVSFTIEPWPRWRFSLPDGTIVEHAVAAIHDRPVVTLSWRVVEPRPGVRLEIRPLLSGRDYHSLHHENPAFRFAEECIGERTIWRPYSGIPGIEVVANGAYSSDPLWYRNFLYTEERARGLDHVEDLASPGRFTFDLSRGEASMVLAAVPSGNTAAASPPSAATMLRTLRAREIRRRARFPTRLHRAADAYIVRRNQGLTVVAGYPWFGDWGRDTFIALRGLCLATGRLDEALAILLEWSGALSRGMMPNRFPGRGEAPEFSTVDAALWFVVAAHEFRGAMSASARRLAKADDAVLRRTVEAILTGYADGTRHGIGATGDGLLAAGEPGLALTWMDTRTGGRAITPRIGKPVEIQALWINVLRIGSVWSERWRDLHGRALEAFRDRFPVRGAAHLHDVVDADHRPGYDDATFRPNQIFAIGGLPFALIEGDAARAVVDAVEDRLLTPLGLRTLDPRHPDYRARYAGGQAERDGAYHQGTAWPWLLGPFVEAWVRVRGATPMVRREARRRFIEPLAQHLDLAGLEHLSEVADGDAPHRPGGCPFQAWSVGEILRLSLLVLAEDSTRSTKRRVTRASRPPEAARGA